MSKRLSKKEKANMSKYQAEIEERIRSIFAEMDELVLKNHGTRLSGASLPITFGFSKRSWASYSCYLRKKGEKYKLENEHFRFSLRHFVSKDEISLADSTFRNIVIHEYAHYMVTHLYPKAAREEAAHGETWEECCYELGITPIVTYINEQLYKEWAHLLRPTSDEPSATIEEQ